VKEILNSSIPLVHAVTEWLCKKAQTTPSGVPSLDHMIILVPTRQAGRRLREALAAAFPNGCIPPKTIPASTLLQPMAEKERPVITRAESIALLSAMLETLDLSKYPALFPVKGRPLEQNFTWALAIAGQLHLLWNSLEESALSMGDVAEKIDTLLQGEDLDVEIERWRDLADIEERFHEKVIEFSRTPLTVAVKNAIRNPAIPDGCTEIVLPALIDGVPALYQALENTPSGINTTILIQFAGDVEAAFDKYGIPDPAFWNGNESPLIPLDDNQIHAAQDSAEQAEAVAAYFAAIPAEQALPALGMTDANLFNELESAFLNKGVRIHNPAGTSLSTSSLAQLILQIRRFCSDASYALLASFLRQTDTARLLNLEDGNHALLLQALDQIQNTHIPQTVAETLKFCNDELAELKSKKELKSYEERRIPGLQLLSSAIDSLLKQVEKAPGVNPVDHLINSLKLFFKGRILTDINSVDRELAAAASKILDIRDNLNSPLIKELLKEQDISHLFDDMLQNSIYQLEASRESELLTEGWLELAWNPASEIVISGFNEGSIPVATVGHAYLPDRLRKALNMLCNELRTARDTYLLYTLTATRQPEAVQIHMERVTASGDVRKPSRLLFKCDDSTLAARAKRLFAESEKTPVERPRTLPERWKLKLPLPDEAKAPESLSVSAVSGYLKCPFTFYLDNILKMREQSDRTEEMDALVFGNLCHEAIERFGESLLISSTDAAEISEFLASQVHSLAEKYYGAPTPAVIQLQVQTAAKRLSFFAEIQAQRTAGGWQIVAGEDRFNYVVDGIAIRGRADRIDYHSKDNIVQIIDFKTWNKSPADKGKAKFATRSSATVDAATSRGLNQYTFDDKEGYVLTDMQLPLYMLMMPAKYLKNSQTTIECAYFVLGESRIHCKCFSWNFDNHRQSVLNDLDLLIKNIKQGIYWPPSPLEPWKYSYEKLFMEKPEGEICDAWIADQQRRTQSSLTPNHEFTAKHIN
jgi:ATP-dependent helicase/nuclease subunit B